MRVKDGRIQNFRPLLIFLFDLGGFGVQCVVGNVTVVTFSPSPAGRPAVRGVEMVPMPQSGGGSGGVPVNLHPQFPPPHTVASPPGPLLFHQLLYGHLP